MKVLNVSLVKNIEASKGRAWRAAEPVMRLKKLEQKEYRKQLKKLEQEALKLTDHPKGAIRHHTLRPTHISQPINYPLFNGIAGWLEVSPELSA